MREEVADLRQAHPFQGFVSVPRGGCEPAALMHADVQNAPDRLKEAAASIACMRFATIIPVEGSATVRCGTVVALVEHVCCIWHTVTVM